jgi:flagellar hook-associated protein 3 FlgL
MRVDPNYIGNLSAALSQSSLAEQTLTTELSSGLAVSQLSDNPVAAEQAQLLASSLSNLDSFTQTASGETGVLQVTDTTLGEVVTQITSAISLATSAGAALSPSELGTVAQQVSSIRDQVLSLANTSYLGQYLFSGSQGSVKPFTLNPGTTPATTTYHGDTQTQSIETPTGQAVQVNLPGSSIFTASGTGVLETLNQLVVDIGNGDTAAIAADSAALSTGLSNVSAQRSVLDGSLSQLQTTSTYAQTQATLLQAQQATLVQADPAQVASELSSAETQNQALLNVIAALANSKNDLFQYL